MRSGGLRPLVLLGVLALAACSSGEAEGDVTAPPSAPATSETLTAEPTGEPTETGEAVAPPEMPAEAADQTAQGAAAFVSYWFDLVNYAYASGDTAALDEVSHEECEACVSVLDQVAEVYGNGGEIRGGEIVVKSAEASAVDEAGISLISTVYDQAPLQEIDRDGDLIRESAVEQDELVAFYAQFESDRWIAFGVSRG